MQTTSAMKETANESENENGPEQSTSRLTTLPQCDGSDEFITRDYHRMFPDNQGVPHVYLKCATKGIKRGGSR